MIKEVSHAPNRLNAQKREDVKNKVREASLRSWKNPSYRAKVILGERKKAIEQFKDPKQHEMRREVMRQTATRLWSEDRERMLLVIHVNRLKRPTEPELITQRMLSKIAPNQWKYSGDGTEIIGWKNPDFINCNGQKKIIEVLGDYWHPKEDETKLPEYYAKFGFQCLTVWQHDLLKNPEAVEAKLTEFNLLEVTC